jgi:7-carboxy-7-deazaguanine synthase
MFGRNEIVGKKYFKEADGKYLVTSMFYTLQGEGPFAGRPAVFIRLAKCNLACSFCDTYFDSGDWMTIEEIKIKAWKTVEDHFHGWTPDWVYHYPPIIVLTGGEPSLQNLYPLIDQLRWIYSEVQIESNGILPVEISDDTVLVVSPKRVEKKGKVGEYIKPHADVLSRANCLKFVVSAEGPYSTLPDWAHDWAVTGGDVYISPMNIYNEEPQAAKTARNSNQTSMEQRSTVEEVISFWTPKLLNLEQNQANHEYAAKLCMLYGFKLNLQMHLYVGKA